MALADRLDIALTRIEAALAERAAEATAAATRHAGLKAAAAEAVAALDAIVGTG